MAIYWGCLTAGRIVFGVVVDRFGAERLLRHGMAAALAGAVLLWLDIADWLSFAALALLGFALAPVFPCLMSLTPKRVGSATAAHAIGFQVSAAMVGAFSLPALAGVLAQPFGLEVISFMLVVLAVGLFAGHEFLLHRLRRSTPPVVST